jgi:hypothetical protein
VRASISAASLLIALASCQRGQGDPAGAVAKVTDRATSPAIAAPAGAWTAGPYTAIARGHHAAELLPDDRVLIVGGRTNIHDPDGHGTGMEIVATRPDQDLAVYRNAPRRIGHTLTRLRDGRVVILGGTEADAPMAAQSTWIYDPSRNAWTFPSGPLGPAPVYHTTTLLEGGALLVAGGRRNGFPVSAAEADVVIFDPSTGTSRALPPLFKARADHTATLLADGRVLIVGGWSRDGALGDAEVYDPEAGAHQAIPGAAPRSHHTATLLGDGRVLLVGGRDDGATEIFDPRASRFLPAARPPEPSRRHHTATRLPRGGVLVAGGYVTGRGAIADAAVYASGTWRRVTPLADARTGHTATLLSDGRVLVAGGDNLAAGADRRAHMDPYVRSTEIFRETD